MASDDRVTIRSLAAELGVAPITVSRALRKHASVRPELTAQITDLAARRGYRSDPVISEVMGRLGRSSEAHYRETVAFVWTHRLSNPQAEEDGARAAAQALGYKLEIIKPGTESNVSRILWSRGIRGVLLAPNHSENQPRYELDWPKFAAVLLGSSLVNPGLTRVARDYFHDASLAMIKLRETGSVRPAMALEATTHERTDRRYAAAFLTHGGTPSRLYVTRQSTAAPCDRPHFHAWLNRTKPDTILIDGERLAKWIPAGTPCVHLCLRTTRGTGIRPDFARIGADALRLLDSSLRENRLGLVKSPTTVLIPGTWITEP